MSWSKACLIFALALGVAAASAQVHRCKDASGKMLFSDRPCGAGQTGEQIQHRRTQEEIYLERMQAYEAEVRKQQRLGTEREREVHKAQTQQYQQAAPLGRHGGNDWQRRKDLENARTSASSITNSGGKWDQAAEAQREHERREEARRRAAQVKPTAITACDNGFCQDNLGGSYHRWDKDHMTGPNGKACHRTGTGAGSVWNCY